MRTESLPDTESDAGRESDPNFVTALARGLELLRAFRPGDTLLGNQEFVRRTGFPKATVSRLAGTLVALGYLRYDDALGKYGLDAGVLALGFAYLASSDVVQLARPHMSAFAQRHGVSISLGRRERLDMVYLETIRHDSPAMGGSSGLGVGSRLSMLSSSMGRAYLAALPAARRERLYDALRTQQPAQWAAEGAAAADAVKAGIREGYAVSLRDWHPAIHACAVGFFAPGQREPYVVSCSAPHTAADAERIRAELVPALRELAARLGRAVQPAG
ncbi:IclR family transcriptional regulator (plasmid) [Ralstonia syzygii subsp. celebesensis]|uniref:IclR family transcriptional regulator n=2 Tax=Ralstonia syzygii subsp. celebesensis TaxID=1310168 RepID=A0A1U9VMY0_9RALS|nr:IclR family transcriptional regulator [Ralstonia syzygii]AQW32048.1 IclR family transcriptional regulator [blood disease bacterium A2-HR MARDI]QQV57448.1 IclR family transcriptional regulator [Ralstonia syzygii subsp. celebesensis]CCA82804.1 putative transcriptional regulator, IclR family [blood disease bacterium R229]